MRGFRIQILVYVTLCSEEHSLEGVTCSDCADVPTLSELIEACGEEFRDLLKMRSKDYEWEAEGYYFCCDEHGEGRRFGQGKTPEEAVSRLWLALNKKT